MKVSALEKTWRKLLADCVQAAREMGGSDPQIYIEGGSGLYVFDGPPHDESGRAREEAVLFRLLYDINGPHPDVGAW